MTTQQEYEGEGDFAMYLWEVPPSHEELADRVVRFHNRDEMMEAARRLQRGGRFKYIWLGKWDYDEEEDSIEIDELWVK